MENFWFDAKHIVSILDKNLEKIFKLYCKDFKESKELNISDIDDMENFRKDVFFVFITRKGYWLFKSLSATLEHKPEYSKYFYLKQIDGKIERNYCTDRFLDKQVNLDFLVGRKKIYVIDDSITRGKSLKHYYEKIKNCSNANAQVIPMTLAVGTEFIKKVFADKMKSDSIKSDDHIENKKNDDNYDFEDKLVFSYEMTQDDIARFCIEETKIFQDNLNALVMDLPIYNTFIDDDIDFEAVLQNANTDCGFSNRYSCINVSAEQFEDLISSDEKWEYFSNGYMLTDEEICCDYFSLSNRLLDQRLGNFFYNYIVKCKYNRTEDNNVNVVFTPFAMVRSCSFKDLWTAFQAIFEGTEYYEQIIAFIDETKFDKNSSAKSFFCNPDTMPDFKDENSINGILINNMYTGVYRAVISSLSVFVMRIFNEKVKQVFGKRLGFDILHFLENNSLEYCRSVFESVYGTEKNPLSIEDYLKNISELDIEGETKSTDVSPWQGKATEQRVEYVVRDYMIQHKKDKEESNREIKFVPIENIESQLECMTFDSENQKKRYLTKTIVTLLELSCMSNYVDVRIDDRKIVRAFRHGENSEILMTPGAKWLYPYFYRLYFNRGASYYKSHIDSFTEWLKDEFDSNNYTNNLISKDELIFLISYFKRIKDYELYRQILSKKYYLDFYNDTDEMTNPWTFFMEKAFRQTDNWSVENP